MINQANGLATTDECGIESVSPKANGPCIFLEFVYNNMKEHIIFEIQCFFVFEISEALRLAETITVRMNDA